jgi:hypothetical protein
MNPCPQQGPLTFQILKQIAAVLSGIFWSRLRAQGLLPNSSIYETVFQLEAPCGCFDPTIAAAAAAAA